jgi:hypothetical protein
MSVPAHGRHLPEAALNNILPDRDKRLILDRFKLKSVDLWSADVKYDQGAPWMEWAVTPPLFVEVGGAPRAVVTRYEDAKIALEDHQRFSNVKRPWPGTENLIDLEFRPQIVSGSKERSPRSVPLHDN